MKDVRDGLQCVPWQYARSKTIPVKVHGKEVAEDEYDEDEEYEDDEEEHEDEEYDEENMPERLRDHALFIAYAPTEAPEIALSVVVENGGGGGRTAAPIARQVLDEFFRIRSEQSPNDL